MFAYSSESECLPARPAKVQLHLLENHVDELSDSELIAIILNHTSSQPPKEVQRQAQALGQPGRAQLGRLTVREMRDTYGLNHNRAATLAAALELGKRTSRGNSSISVDCPEAALPLLQDMLGLPKEHFRALYLNSKKRLIKCETISIGDLNSSVVHPREVFRSAIAHNADSLILAHNHPSGDPTPSSSDLESTKALVEAGQLLRISVVDHIIIGDGSYVSLRRQGLLE